MAKRNVNVFGTFLEAVNLEKVNPQMETTPALGKAMDVLLQKLAERAETTPTVGKAMDVLLQDLAGMKLAGQDSCDVLALSSHVTSKDIALPLYLESLTELQKLKLVQINSVANQQLVSLTAAGNSLMSQSTGKMNQ